MKAAQLFHFSRQRAVFLLLSLLVSSGVLWYLYTTISLAELLAIIRGVPLAGLALFVLFSLTMSAFRTWRYSLLLSLSGQQVATFPLYLITLVRNLFADLLPARLGTLIFIYLARTRLGVSWSSASAGFAYSFIFDFISLGFIILLATLAASGVSQHPLLLIFAGLILAGISIGLLILLPRLLQIGSSLLNRFSFLSPVTRNRIAEASTALRAELLRIQQSGMFSRILMLSLGVRGCKYLALYVLLLCLVLPAGYTVSDFPLAKVFFGLTAAEMAASLPISGIAGFGAYEGAWSLVFQLLGYPAKLSALTSVSHHLLSQVYGYALGALAFLLLLLPWRVSAKAVRARLIGGARFYLGATLLFLLPFALSMVILLWTPALYSAQGANPGTVATSPVPAAPPPGRLVFQRPGGIATISIGSNKERLLTASGTYPRWSPDGEHIAFFDGNRLKLMGKDGQRQREIAVVDGGRAICFHPDGQKVIFTDGAKIRQVDITTGKTTDLVSGNTFFELDIADDGATLVATEKNLGGYRVVIFDLRDGRRTNLARGCSASISPNGQKVTVNSSDHRFLHLYSRQNLAPEGTLTMIDNKKFDNQSWSNHQDWLASKSEGDDENIYVHHVPSGAAFQATFTGQADRPDYFIAP